MIDLTCAASAADLAALSTRVGPAARVINVFDGGDEDVTAIRARLEKDFAPFVKGETARVPACLNMITARKG